MILSGTKEGSSDVFRKRMILSGICVTGNSINLRVLIDGKISSM